MEGKKTGLPNADFLEKFYEAQKPSMTPEEWGRFLKDREKRRREIQRAFQLPRGFLNTILRNTA